MAGVEGIDTSRGLRLNVADHALDAASEGMGVVLAYKVVAARDIVLGRLVSPFGPEMPVPGRAYYFVCAKGQEKPAPIKAFRDRVFAEIEETHASLRNSLVHSNNIRPTPPNLPVQQRGRHQNRGKGASRP